MGGGVTCLLVAALARAEEVTWAPASSLRELRTWRLPRRAAGADAVPPQWVNACDQAGYCGNYSKGSGNCPLAVLLGNAPRNLAAFTVVPVHSACRTRQAGWAFHCPTEVPVAVFLVEKAGYMSGQSWLAGMDAVPARVPISAVTLKRKWEEAGAAALLGGKSFSREWLEPELRDAGYEANIAREVSEYAAAYHSYKDSVDVTRTLEPDPDKYVRIWLPPHLCPSCCSLPATGRLQLVLVRNPFSRLVSYFRMRLLGNSEHPGMNTWNDFPAFIDLVDKIRKETEAYVQLPVVWSHPLKQLGADKDFIFHTRSVSEWLLELGLTAKAGGDIHPVRLEQLPRDIEAVEQRLCKELAYCEPLPAFPHLHDGTGALGSDAPQREPPDLWSNKLRAEVWRNYRADFEAFGYGPDPQRRAPVPPPFCVVISAHYKQPTRALRSSLYELGRVHRGEVIAIVVDDASPIPVRQLLPSAVPGVELHILRNDHVHYGPELGAWGLALDSGLCDGARVYALLLSAVSIQARFDFDHLLPCPLSPIWTFPLRPPTDGEYGCCAGSGCPHKENDNGWARPEFRQWVLEHLPEAVRANWTSEEPQAGVQGPSFLATADGLQRLRSTGVFKVRTDEEWMQQSSERLLALIFKILGHEPAECNIEGNLFANFFAVEAGECHPHPYLNPIVQPGRTKRGRYFVKTFGVVPGKKWRKVYLVNEFGLRPQLFAEWRRSPEYTALVARLGAFVDEPGRAMERGRGLERSLAWTVRLTAAAGVVRMPSVGVTISRTQGIRSCHSSVVHALDQGFRRVEAVGLGHACARAVGRALSESAVPRSALFVVVGGLSCEIRAAAFAQYVRSQLAELRLSYADLYLLPSVSCTGLHNDHWKVLEALHASGIIRALGIRGSGEEQLAEMATFSALPVAVLHRHGLPASQTSHPSTGAVTVSVLPISGALGLSLGSQVAEIAEQRGLTEVQLHYRWALHCGIAVSVTASDNRLLSMLAPMQLFGFRLTASEAAVLDGVMEKSSSAAAVTKSAPGGSATTDALSMLERQAIHLSHTSDASSQDLSFAATSLSSRIDAVLAENWSAVDAAGAEALQAALKHPSVGAAMAGFPHSRDVFLEHLRNVWSLMAVWGQTRPIRLFGLLHSFFGTESFKFSVVKDLDKGLSILETLVGSQAADLIWKFGQINETEMVEKVKHAGKIPPEGIKVSNLLRFSQPVVLSARDVASILVMTIADLFDQSFTVNAWRDVTLKESPKKLWPGLALPAMNIAPLAQRCAFALPYLDVAPPIFNSCTAELDNDAAQQARELYWSVVAGEDMDVMQRLSYLDASARMNPYLAEPQVLLAQLRFAHGDPIGAEQAAEEALHIFYTWGTCWDKRIPFRQWVAFTRLLLLRAQRRLEGAMPSLDLPLSPAGRVSLESIYSSASAVDRNVETNIREQAAAPVGMTETEVPNAAPVSKTATPARNCSMGILASMARRRPLPKAQATDYDGLRIFVYDLNSSYNADLVDEMTADAQDAGSNCDFMLAPCTEQRWVSSFSTARQWGAEVIILRKLLASPGLVHDPHEADLYVVPYLIATDCRLRGHHVRCLTLTRIEELFKQLEHYNVQTRHRHLFLATADIHSLPLAIQAQPLIVSYGASRSHPGHIVVPPSVTEAEIQPGTFKEVSENERNILFWLAQTPNNAVRYMVQRQLISFDEQFPEEERRRMFQVPGSIRVHVMGRTGGAAPPSPAEMLSEMRRALFCPAPPAENAAAGTKRFFDVLLAGCLPVVIAYETVWGSGISWWRRDGAPVEWSLPFAAKIDWRRLAIEVPVQSLEHDGQFVASVLGIPQEERLAKRKYLLEVREQLLYDLEGGARDAFSMLMDEIRAAIAQLGPHSALRANSLTSRFHPSSATVCDASPRGLDFHTLPSEFGEGIGHEKAWAHTFGEVSCKPAHLWHPIISDCRPNAFKGQRSSTMVAERFFTTQMLRTQHGSGLYLQELRTSEVKDKPESAALAHAPAAFCTHETWPMACHDTIREGGDGMTMQLCSRSAVVNSPPRTSCRLLPATIPMMPPTMGLGATEPVMNWEIVTWGCGVSDAVRTLGEEAEEGWLARMPRNYALNVIVYEVCSPDAINQTPEGRAHKPPSWTLFHHILAQAHAVQNGQQTADAVLLLPDQWIEPWVTPWEMRPRHFVNMLSEMMTEHASRNSSSANRTAKRSNVTAATPDEASPGSEASRLEANAGRRPFLWVFDGPNKGASRKVCERYSHLFNARCPVPRSMDQVAAQAVVFSTDLLRDAPLSEWEAAAMHVDGVERAWPPDFNLLISLLAKQAGEAQMALVAFAAP